MPSRKPWSGLAGAKGKTIHLKGLRKLLNDLVQWMRARGFTRLPDLLERLTDADALAMIVEGPRGDHGGRGDGVSGRRGS